MVPEELFEHFSGRDEEVAVTSLASELEGVLGRRFRPIVLIDDGHFDIGHDRHLQLPLDTLDKAVKVRRDTEAGKLWTRGNVHVGFEWNMILMGVQYVIIYSAPFTYQQHRSRNLDLALWSKYGDNVRRRFLGREANLRVRFGFDVVDENGLFSQQSTVVPPRDRNSLVDVVLVLHEISLDSGSPK
jgi:hypothetical protein